MDVSQRVMTLLTGELCYARFGLPIVPAVIARGYVACCLAELGNFAEGASMGEDVVLLAEAGTQPPSIAIALTWVGLLSRRQGALSKAIPVLERSLALCQNANIALLFPMIGSILGVTYALAGHAAEALPLLDQVLERLASESRMLYHALVLTELSEALLCVGRVDMASTLAERLLELSRTHTGHGYQAHAHRLLGDVATRCDPPDIIQAEAHYRQALALTEEIGMRPLQAHCHRGLSTLYAKIDRPEQARMALSAAINLYRAMEMTFWLPQVEAALAQVET
jgi:tetratricopeptide (TPR) repeat protein